MKASSRCKNKRKYRDELAAKIALAKLQVRDKGEKRAYRCPLCRSWHTTQQEKGRA